MCALFVRVVDTVRKVAIFTVLLRKGITYHKSLKQTYWLSWSVLMKCRLDSSVAVSTVICILCGLA